MLNQITTPSTSVSRFQNKFGKFTFDENLLKKSWIYVKWYQRISDCEKFQIESDQSWEPKI